MSHPGAYDYRGHQDYMAYRNPWTFRLESHRMKPSSRPVQWLVRQTGPTARHVDMCSAAGHWQLPSASSEYNDTSCPHSSTPVPLDERTWSTVPPGRRLFVSRLNIPQRAVPPGERSWIRTHSAQLQNTAQSDHRIGRRLFSEGS